jgi:hypothetical protein
VSVCWFAFFRQPGAVLTAQEDTRLSTLLAATPHLEQGLIFTPGSTDDPYLDDGAPPALALQLYFADIADLEGALASGGHLQALADAGFLPSLSGADVSQQAMLVRRFPVPDPVFRPVPNEPICTYLVAYEGEAEDLNAWLGYYVAGHPPVMARFPGVRQIEIFTRLDWIGFLPWRRVGAMQRNKVVFDNDAALTSALNSPVRHEMRADFARFPAFSGPVAHYPMATRCVNKPERT